MKNERIGFIGLMIVALMVIPISYLAFLSYTNNNLEKSTFDRLKRISSSNTISFDLQINEQIKKVETMAQYFGESGDLGNDDHIILLKSAAENNDLLRCAIAFPDGSFVTNDGLNNGSVSEELFFTEGMKGNFYITDPMPAVVEDDKRVILFNSPIVKNGTVIGVLSYSYLCDDIDKMFNLSLLDGGVGIFVIKESGEILIGESSYSDGVGNILQIMRNNCQHKDHNPADCSKIVGDSGILSINSINTNEKIFVGYNHLEFNDWYMLYIISENDATKTIPLLTHKDKSTVLLIGLIITAYLCFVLFIWLNKMTHMDKMTGAPTYDCFKRSAKNLIRKNPDQRFVAMKLDIKNFKLINRIYDFSEGNRVIKNIVVALRLVFNNPNTAFARIGADNFVLLVPFTDNQTLEDFRNEFINKFKELMGEHFTTNIEFPIGQYITTAQDAIKPDIAEIFEKVNFAHCSAKQEGRVIVVDYEENIEKEAIFQKSIEDKMNDALKNHEFKLFLQPKYRVSDEVVCGAEALVRWEVEGRHIMYPVDFVPVFEKNGFIVKIDKYMFEKSVEKIREVMDMGLKVTPISVNFSRHNLNNQNFVEELCEITDRYDVPHKYLEIELTESLVFGNIGLMIELIEKLHNAGFTLSMDDFGSGYSSLCLLKNLEVDVLKIDRAFFEDSLDSNRSKIILTNIVRLAKELGIITVAEGVETKDHVDMLRDLGCDIIQGYYYAKPMNADKFDFSAYKKD